MEHSLPFCRFTCKSTWMKFYEMNICYIVRFNRTVDNRIRSTLQKSIMMPKKRNDQIYSNLFKKIQHTHVISIFWTPNVIEHSIAYEIYLKFLPFFKVPFLKNALMHIAHSTLYIHTACKFCIIYFSRFGAIFIKIY